MKCKYWAVQILRTLSGQIWPPPPVTLGHTIRDPHLNYVMPGLSSDPHNQVHYQRFCTVLGWRRQLNMCKWKIVNSTLWPRAFVAKQILVIEFRNLKIFYTQKCDLWDINFIQSLVSNLDWIQPRMSTSVLASPALQCPLLVLQLFVTVYLGLTCGDNVDLNINCKWFYWLY
jgi:hypothetical protein